jgi:SAM-dependent methyltransferase
MHASVMEYVGQAISTYGLASLRTLELGSTDINGSVRGLFMGEYIGIDHATGEGVDLVMSASALTFPDASFDVVVSTSMLEHDPAFWLTLPEVGRVLRPGGHFILTTVSTGCDPHNPPDYWRFLPDTWPLLMDMARCRIIDARDDPDMPKGGPQLTGVRR